MTDDLKKLTDYRFQQAEETLNAAQTLLDNGYHRDAVNRAYYAMFYCCLGLLAAKNLGSSKHSGVLSLLNRHYVKTGDIPVETGRHLREAFELRQQCDYREFVEVKKSQIEEAIENAKQFIAAAHKVLETAGK